MTRNSRVNKTPFNHPSRRRLILICCFAIAINHAVSVSELVALSAEPLAGSVTTIANVVKKTKVAAATDPNIQNQVETATGRLLLAEMATRDTERLGLWTLAVDQFESGMAELAEIESQIAKVPDLERELSETPRLAMRLDAVRVRQETAAGQLQLARDAEKARLSQLRQIARAYRQLLGKMAEADMHLRLGNYPKARRANLDVLLGIGEIYKATRDRQDYYLFDDEPNLDPNSDFKVLQAISPPLRIDMIAHVKAIQALATCRMAIQDVSKVDVALLDEANQWADAALTGSTSQIAETSLPEGHSADNPIALFALGLVNESRGLLITRENQAQLAAHEQAEPFFEMAEKHYTLASAKIASQFPNSESLSQLAGEAKQRQIALKSSASSLSIVAKQTTAGHPDLAWQPLLDATMRHRDVDAWLGLLETGRRAKIDSNQLNEFASSAIAEEILVNSHAPTQIVLSKLTADRIWNEVKKVGLANVPPATRQRYTAELTDQASRLRVLLPSIDDETLKAEGSAVLALALAYQTSLFPNSKEQRVRLQEAYRLARDSMLVLESAVQSEQDEYRKISSREGLIASRLAYAHTALQTLPEYRDDALLGFAAAFDEMSKLPFQRGDVSLLGSPLLTSLSGQTGQSSARLALEERRFRELLSRFLEGMYTLNYGDPAMASDQMKTALDGAKLSNQGGEDSSVQDAAAALGRTDGFEAVSTIEDSVHAFKILADVKADRGELALLSSIGFLNPSLKLKSVDAVTEPILARTIDQVQSPWVGFALASAIEAYINSRENDGSDRQQMLIRKAVDAFAKVDEQLTARRMQTKYPHLISMVQEAKSRLDSTEIYRQDAVELRARGELELASDLLARGLKRHPNDQTLWRLYLDMRLEGLHRHTSESVSYRQFLGEVQKAKDRDAISEFEANYFSASAYEGLQRFEDSLAAYEVALSAANSPRDRVRALSKVSELRSRLAFSSK
ncbi:hypothetical protein [Novipirellula sp.]|uniref:hypothetical protein n=1 Tax=Novipirellula sp. TaxID=2795430 RepID=UPI003563178F